MKMKSNQVTSPRTERVEGYCRDNKLSSHGISSQKEKCLPPLSALRRNAQVKSEDKSQI